MSAFSSLITSQSSLQAWYRLNETSGTTAHDNTSNGYHATLAGISAYSTAGLVAFDADNAISFSASGGVRFPASLSLAMQSWSSLSIVAWMTVSGAVHCVGLTATAGALAYYYDGNLISPGSGAAILVSQALDMIGSLTSSATIDEVMIFSAALPARTFRAIAQSGGLNPDYTATNGTGGSTGLWLRDTANGRIEAIGGNKSTLLLTGLTVTDVDLVCDLWQAQSGGLTWRWVDSNNYYEVAARDSAASGSPNTVTLNKYIAGSLTQLATISVTMTTQKHRYLRVTMFGHAITVLVDGVQVLSATDSSLSSGSVGLRNDGGTSWFYKFQVTPQGQDVTGLAIQTKATLTSTDPTQTPQLLDLQTFVGSEDIDPGALISTGNYVNTYVSDNVADLNTQSASTWWYVRANKSVVFRQRTATPAPWVLDSTNSGTYLNKVQGDLLVAGLNVTDSGDLYRNRQGLTGVIGSIAIDKAFSGDGQTTTWNLDYPLISAPVIMLNGQQQTVGQQGATGYQYYYQVGSTAINQDSSGTALQGADMLRVTGSGSFVTDTTRDNAAPGTFPNTISQAEQAAIDGTSGIIENITDVSNMSLDASGAEAYGDRLLQLYGNPAAKTITFSTYRPGIRSGQALTCFVPEQNCFGVQALITQVSISAKIAPSVPGGVLYLYSVIATEGANLGSSWKQLSSMIKG